MKRIALVTGATGFIGKRIVARLRERGWIVHASTRKQALDGSVVFDLATDDLVTLPSGIDTIFHLAGKAHSLSEVAQDDAEYTRINTDGTRRILEAARRVGVRAFVLFSTVKAVSDCDSRIGPIDETFENEPNTPYGKSKRAAERLVLEGGYVQHPVVLRPCLVYGPSPKGNLEKMIRMVRQGKFPPLPEFGNKRSMVHVDDVVSAAILVAQEADAKGKVFIVADNAPFSSRQLYEWICLACGRRVPRWSVPLWLLRFFGKAGDIIGRSRHRRFFFDSDALSKLVGNAWYTSSKIQNELGWLPQYTLREAMTLIVRPQEVEPANERL